MSRIGKKPVGIPSGVTVEVKGSTVITKGPKGELKLALLPEVGVKIEGSSVVIERKNDERAGRARHGLTRQLIANMIEGVNTGYTKKLEIIGVGYKAQAKGKSVTLNLGFSHPIEFKAPEGVDIQQDPENKQILLITGIDKAKVGQTAADIRRYREPEPYKGKGIRYVGEFVPRKVGKAAVKGGTAA
ncbi:MAG TPA: 50S ribosomal protein L6 [Candidatus Peribacterales bacterium]|nr:50S ribosomal protein L6 [Candidatus Peribacterales bacterium]